MHMGRPKGSRADRTPARGVRLAHTPPRGQPSRTRGGGRQTGGERAHNMGYAGEGPDVGLLVTSARAAAAETRAALVESRTRRANLLATAGRIESDCRDLRARAQTLLGSPR